jgi:DNA-directed RNA polymerase specialized sigma subunit
VFLLYYRDSLTLREIAQQLGVSVSSATQAHTRLVEQIRERLASLGGVA